jgi:putative hydrolase of the HAD superfamily
MIDLRRIVQDDWNMSDPKPTVDLRYPTPAHGRIPAFQNVEEEAVFWDTHSVTEFPEELQPVRARVRKRLSSPFTVRLDPADRAELTRRAKEQGIGPSTLIRMWVKERLRRDTRESTSSMNGSQKTARGDDADRNGRQIDVEDARMNAEFALPTQHLIFDADDTLWENNIYFEQAFEEFLDFLAHATWSRAQVRAVLDEIELANAGAHGYGSAAFARNLRQTYERLAGEHLRDDDLERVMAFGLRILSQPIEVIDGVEATLAELAARHDLVLLTKGHPEEQRLKIERSGLDSYFRHAAVVPDKTTATYYDLVDELGLDPERAWMIGNSPKSDINPALAAGLGAVFIPHHATWRLEHQEIEAGPGRLLVLERFRDLLGHF